MATSIGRQQLTPYQQVSQWREKQRVRNQAHLETQNLLANQFMGITQTATDGLVGLATQQLATRIQTEQTARMEELQKRAVDVKV